MKIYASRYAHAIEQYIGKGIWVLASSWRWMQKAYIRPIKYDHGILIYNRVDIDIFEDRLVDDLDLERERNSPWSDIDLAYPLETLTDEEMMEHYIKNRDDYFGGEV